MKFIIKNLRKALDWKPTNPKMPDADLQPDLRDELINLEENLRYKNDQIKAAKSFAQEAEGFSGEATYQLQRLESIGLFAPQTHSLEKCPLCSSTLKVPIPSATSINDALTHLASTLASVTTEKPRLREYIQKLELEKR